MTILVICPSNRPQRLEVMLESFTLTKSKDTEILIDTRTDVTITEIFNQAFNKLPDYDFYFMANDDINFMTEGWDIKLSNKGKISYGNDLLQGKDLCTFPMIDGNIVRSLGWLQMPTLERYCGDVVWKFIGDQCKCLEYHGDVFLKHDWHGATHPLEHAEDMARFAEWLPWSFKDIAKIKDIL